MSLVEMTRGDSPVILSFPHTGTEVPRRIWERLNENGRILADTDWHVHRLYLFEGRLPDFNIGTDHGVTCDPAIEGAVVAVTRSAPGFDTVLNGRFRGDGRRGTMAGRRPAYIPSKWSWPKVRISAPSRRRLTMTCRRRRRCGERSRISWRDWRELRLN